MDQEYIDLSRAIILYTQKGKARWPQSDDRAVVEEFGEKKATTLIGRIEALAAEMRMIEVDMASQSLGSATNVVRGETAMRHPNLSREALDAIAWKWSFENR